MNKKLTRRSFVMSGLSGIGAFALSNPLLFDRKNERIIAENSKAKRLFATTDIYDNILINCRGSRYGIPIARPDDYYENHRCFMDRTQLDGLHHFLVSLGVTRHQWIVETIWTLYEDYPHGFDLLKEAVKSAHDQGLEFYAEIKPFESGGFGYCLPHTMPYPNGAVAFRDLRGILPVASPFAVAHPEMNLKRRTGTFDCNGPVSAIRLVKRDDRPTRIKAGDLSVWTSSLNNGFLPYRGPLTFRETIEKRYRFPYWGKCRILHIENLELPKGHNYILIRCSVADEKGDFSNEKGNIIELAGNDGKEIPHTLSTGPVSLEEHDKSFYRSKVMKQLVRYLQLPEVQAEISDWQKMQEHYRNFYGFGEYNPTDRMTLDKEGYVAVACGKPRYIFGNLHPVYPEVREYWLDLIRFCLDRGVDGINLRVGNHTRSPEYWEYGFNEPVIKTTGGYTNYREIARTNGDTYTQFLREARELVKSRRKTLTVHLNADMLIPDDRPGKLNSLPPNFEWQWETWIREIADELEFRGIFKLRPWHLKQVLDTFITLTKSAGKPFYLQGDFHGMTFKGPFYSTEAETDLVNQYDGLDGYVFYETANIIKINENGKIEGSSEVMKVLNKHFFRK